MEGEPGVSIVIPAWNEADRIGATLDRYLGTLVQLNVPHEIIVVLDGVLDHTGMVVDGFANRGVRKLVFPHKLGKGGAVMAGLRAARYSYLGFVDADGAVPPHELAKMLGSLKHFDCVVASRWLTGSRVIQQEPLFNVFAGRVYNLLVRSVLFLPVRDTQCGAKFLRREIADRALTAVAITNRTFEVSLLFHVRESGGKIAEIPVEWTHDGRSRMPIGKAIPIMFLSLLGVRVMNSPLQRYVPRGIVKSLAVKWGAI